jgi:pimeloyl-ACP methyl ester carboxylesterase
MAGMNKETSDRPIVFGAENSIIGIVTKPALGSSEALPAIVVLNTGIVYRIGNNRMYVTLARTLAEAGYTVLRFDMSGIGDSDNRRGGLAPLEACLADVRDAVDWMAANLRVRQVILVGLCAGADHAALFASRDRRVRGLVLIDPNMPPNFSDLFRAFRRGVLRVGAWPHFFKVEGLGGLIWKTLRKTLDKAERVKLQDPILRSQLREAYRNAVKSEIQMLVIFTQAGRHKTLANLVNGPNSTEVFRIERLDRTDHFFSFEADRTQLFDVIMNWVRETAFSEVRRCTTDKQIG